MLVASSVKLPIGILRFRSYGVKNFLLYIPCGFRPARLTIFTTCLLSLTILIYISYVGFLKPNLGWDSRTLPNSRTVKRALKSRLPKVFTGSDYDFVKNTFEVCRNGEQIDLLIMVTSAPSHAVQRQSIRSTWGVPEVLKRRRIKLVFLLADSENPYVQRDITKENTKYNDLIESNFIDSYMNLTLKTLMGLRWASEHCRSAKHVMKTDDDIYINIPYLMEYLQQEYDFIDRFVVGCVKQRKPILPVNLPAGVNLPSAHPPFVAGAGYVISGNIAGKLYSAAEGRRIIPVEDVYITAHLAKRVGIFPPKHDQRFTCGEMLMEDCDMAKMFTAHRVSPEQMSRIFQKLDPRIDPNPCFVG